jgi:hypothetical protein
VPSPTLRAAAKASSKPRPKTARKAVAKTRLAPGRRALPRFTDRLSIGGRSVSPFCLGMVEDWQAIPAAFEMGINFFFITTDMHWPLYEACRKGLKALFASKPAARDEIVVAGTCYPTQPEFNVAPFHELVRAVRGLDRIDLLVAGGVYGPDLLARVAVLRHVAAGRAAVGASFHDRQAAAAAANHAVVDLCYIRYNPAHPGARRDLFPQLRAQHAPLFNFKSMRGYVDHARLRELGVDPALWYPEAPDYYRYALSRPEMAGLLFSVTHRRQLAALEAALPRGGLLPEEEDHLDELAVLTKQTTPLMR